MKLHKLLTDLGHIAFGFFAALLPLEHSLVLITLYIIYQISEYLIKRDTLDEDILELLLGYVLGLLVLFILL
ncbi:hypothetical protein J7L13_01885 [bacterium]|nr:hypothetical protein [bacterium]